MPEWLGLLINILTLVLGGVVGWLIPWFDKIAYIYILYPEAQIAQYFKYQLGNKRFKDAWKMLRTRNSEFDKLTTRGLVFQLAYVVLAVFALTSTAGGFGKALVLGLGLRVLFEEWKEFLKNKAELEKKLLWQSATDWSDKELKWYMIIKTAVIAVLVRLVV